MKEKVIAVTGGIGAGKSVICSILTILGYRVYDCDSNARRIMDNDALIKRRLLEEITPAAVDCSGRIDRSSIAEEVFNNPKKLECLNAIVHGAVREDIIRWIHDSDDVSFIETAILYQSGIDRIVDEVWEVTAPEETRISRVCRRNNLSPEQVKSRIHSQNITGITPHKCTRLIVNDNNHSLLLQIDQLLNQ